MSETNLPNKEPLFERVSSKDALLIAFRAVKRNKGAPGIDGVTIEAFEKRLDEELLRLSEELRQWSYYPKPVRSVEIPKPSGGVRKLGIPTVRDRVVQASVKAALEPTLDPLFSENSYGFRPGRSQKDAVQVAQRHVQAGRRYVVDIDLAQFFDRIQHDRLVTRLALFIDDKRILRLIGMMLRSGVMRDGLVQPTTEGSTQGSPLSPLLSNVVLDELDKELEARGLRFCRYADDCNIFVGSAEAGNRVMRSVSTFIEKKLRLRVNWEKSKVALSRSVKFLGMTVLVTHVAISAASMRRAMERVKELTPRGTQLTLERTVQRINGWYVGWAGYYSMTQYPSQLAVIEAHVRRRLRSRIIDQQKRRRHLLEKLASHGVNRYRAAQVVYSNRRRWALSHTAVLEEAFPNAWFRKTLGLKTMSDKKLPHWLPLKKWARVT